MREGAFLIRTLPQFLWVIVSLFVVDALSGAKIWGSSSSNEAEEPYIKRKYPNETWKNLQKLPLSHHHFVEHQINHRSDQNRVPLWQEGYGSFWNTLVGSEKYMCESSHLNLFLESIQHKSANDLYKNPPKVSFKSPILPNDEESLLVGVSVTTVKQNHERMLKTLTDWIIPKETQARALPKGQVKTCVEQGIREEAWTLFHLMMSERALLSQMEETHAQFLKKATFLYDLMNEGKQLHDALPNAASNAAITDDVRIASESEFTAKTHALNVGLRQLEKDLENRRLFINTLQSHFRLPDERDTSLTIWNLLVKVKIVYSWRDQFMTGTINPMVRPDHVQTVYDMFEGHVIQGNEERRALIFGSKNPIFDYPMVKNAASVAQTNIDNDESA